MVSGSALEILIGVKDQLTGKLNELSGKVDSFAGKVDSVMRKAEGGSLALAGGMAAIGAAVVGVGGYAIKLAGDLEMTTAAFETMLGSSEAAGNMLKDITEFAAKTPFTMDGLQSSAKLLLNFGIEADKVIPTMQMLGDISGGNQERFSALSLVFAQTASQGKLMGGDLLQMINAGFNPLKVIAEQTGKSMGDLKDEMSKGKITFEMVESAMQAVTKEGGMFYNMMEKQSQTLPGLWSTLEDSVTITLQSIGTELIEAFNLKEIISDAIVWVEGMGAALVEFFQLINKDGFKAALVETFGENTPALLASIAGALTVALIPAVWSAATAFIALMAPIAPFLIAGAAIGALAYTIYDSWDSLVALYNDYVAPAIEYVAGLFTSFLAPIREAMNDLYDTISGAWSDIVGVFSGGVASDNPLSPLINGIKTGLSGLAEIVSTMFGAAFSQIGTIISTAATVAGNVVGAFINLVTGNFTGLRENLGNIVTAIWDGIKNIFVTGVTAALDIAGTLFGWIPGADEKIEGLKERLKTMIPQEAITGAQDVSTAVEGAQGAADDLVIAAGEAGTALESTGQAGVDAGKVITEAMGQSGAGGAVKSLAEQIAEIITTLDQNLVAKEREINFILGTGKQQVEAEIAELTNALKAMANDTTISIDDSRVIEVQKQLILAQQELAAINKADMFKTGIQKAFEDLNEAIKGMGGDQGSINKVSASLESLKDMAVSPEDFKAIASLETALADAAEMAGNNATAIQGALDIADDDTRTMVALDNLYLAFQDIDGQLTGEAALQAKINAVWQAVADGQITMEDASQWTADLYAEWKNVNTEGGKFIQGARSMIATHFPALNQAIESGETAFLAFRSAFKGDNDKTFLENIGSGFTNVGNAINSTKGFMNDFGTASGLILGGLNMAVPGLGSAITGLSSVFEALGIDVSGALNSISDAIAKFFTGNQNMGPMTTAFQFLDNWYNQIMDKTMQFGGDWEALFNDKDLVKNALAQAKNWEDFMEKMAAALDITIDQAKQVFTQQQEQTIKNAVWAGQYDPNTGVGATVSEELKAEIFKMISDLKASGNFSNQEILDMLIAKYTKTPLVTLGIAQLLGLPALAKGGLAFGEAFALVGDNFGASHNPELIAPLDQAVGMIAPIVERTMGGGDSGNISVYLDIDGERFAQIMTRKQQRIYARMGLR